MDSANRGQTPRAFTLIELLVVIAIIGLLISILIPSLSRARTMAKQAVTLAHLRSIGQAMALYEGENRDQHPALVDQEEKAFLGLSLLAKQFDVPPEVFINPSTDDTPAEQRNARGRLILSDMDGSEIVNETDVNLTNVARVRLHCSFAYDNDNKKTFKSAIHVFAYVGDRADYQRGRTISAAWNAGGTCLLFTDQHAEFRKGRSIREQADPNSYHHNEFEGEGGDEIVDGIEVQKFTLDTHLRFFSEEEDDVLLPDNN
ncbi:MAG: prepilin-type N-terminal cleavage/methylation domain-containing protein [Planctomycetota bacterium]